MTSIALCIVIRRKRPAARARRAKPAILRQTNEFFSDAFASGVGDEFASAGKAAAHPGSAVATGVGDEFASSAARAHAGVGAPEHRRVSASAMCRLEARAVVGVRPRRRLD